jgi:hypothetical protein
LASQKTNTIMPPWVVKTILLLASRWGSWPGGGRGLSPSTAPGFESSCARLSPPRCLTYPLGLQGVQWAVRLVVVRASWPGHPRKSKKKNIASSFFFFKKKKKTNTRLLKEMEHLLRRWIVADACRIHESNEHFITIKTIAIKNYIKPFFICKPVNN